MDSGSKLKAITKVYPIVGVCYIAAMLVLHALPSQTAHVASFFMGMFILLIGIAIEIALIVVYKKQVGEEKAEVRKLMLVFMVIMPISLILAAVMMWITLYPW